MADSTRLNVSGLFEYVKTLTTDQDDEIAKARDAADLASEYAIEAGEAAAAADEKAEAASQAAGRAETAASNAVTQAGRAETAASNAVTQAGRAETAANSAVTQAGRAETAANNAVTQAGRAETAANNAVTQAGRAETAANNAVTQAGIAENAANQANYAANSALTQASIVEDVAGTLNWIQEHGSYVLTSDTEIQNGTIYFQYNAQTQDYEPIVLPEEGKNPHQEGWYVLDISDSQSEFILSHLAVTSRGLWVLPNGINSGTVTPDSSIDGTGSDAQTNAKARLGTNYKVLLSNDGMYVYDGMGALVSKFGESITFSANRPQYIGNNNAYISFNPNNSTITIGGNVIMGSTKTLSELLGDISDIQTAVDSTLIYDHRYQVSNGIATFEAFLYRGGVDVKNEFLESQFTWYYKTEADAQIQPLNVNTTKDPMNSGYTITVDIHQLMNYGGHIIGYFTEIEDAALQDRNGTNLLSSNDEQLIARAESGESIRVNELTVATVLYSSDKIMVTGSEDEHLVTVQTLQDYLNVNLDKQVLFNTTAAWDSQVMLQSEANKLYIYTDHYIDSQNNVIAGIKVGDGNAYLIDLPFTDEAIMDHISNTTIHVTSAEKAFWNNKVSCYYAGDETVIYTTA